MGRLAFPVCALFCLLATPVRAEVVSTTDDVAYVDPPADVSVDQTVDGAHIIVFDEMQDVQAPFQIDAVLDNVDGSTVVITEGTWVDSHLVHVDLPDFVPEAEMEGTISFATPILGLLVSTDILILTDPGLGARDTVYGTEPDRTLDTDGDFVMVTAPTELFVHLKTDTALDHVRVLTEGTEPGLPDTGPVDTGPPSPDTGSARDASTPATFRGPGGCSCRVAPSFSAPRSWAVTAFVVFALAGRRRLRRRLTTRGDLPGSAGARRRSSPTRAALRR